MQQPLVVRMGECVGDLEESTYNNLGRLAGERAIERNPVGKRHGQVRPSIDLAMIDETCDARVIQPAQRLHFKHKASMQLRIIASQQLQRHLTAGFRITRSIHLRRGAFGKQHSSREPIHGFILRRTAGRFKLFQR